MMNRHETPEDMLARARIVEARPPAQPETIVVTPAKSEPANSNRELPPFCDDMLAQRFENRHASDLRYVAVWNKWLRWDGARWRLETTLHAFDLARVLCRDAAKTAKPKTAQAVANAKKVAAVTTLARAARRIAATVDQWDADPWLLNTPDGVVDLRTGDMRPHRADDYMIKIASVGPHGDCPKFKAFLSKIMGGDEALVAYLKRALGYCLTGDTREQALFFAHGVGSNGKSVLMATVSGILADYSIATPIETFTESRTDRHPTELARMRGARLVTATETEAGKYWAESRLKELTGGDRVAARFLHQDFFEYRPEFKLFISGNHRPRLRSVGAAMRRRIHMIPFAVTIPEAERDPQLVEKLKGEWPGILQWMIDGCLDWQKGGLAPPEAVVNATDAYFASEDGYADWIADRCELIPRFWSRSSELFASWKSWAERAGQPPGDNKRFREEMERLGFPLKRQKSGNYYVGLRIRQDEPLRDEPGHD
jgi:putative DNA primase/helicase